MAREKKHKDKSGKKTKKRSASSEDLEAMVRALRKENQFLRTRLGQIAGLAQILPDAADSADRVPEIAPAD